MALVPHKFTALAESDADGTDGKNIIAGAVVSLYDPDGNAATLFDDEDYGNGSTAKQTDAKGQVVVYVEQGEYDEEVNGSIRRRILVGSKSNDIISYGTTAEIQALRPNQTGSRIENRERANAQYVLREEGYVAQVGDLTAANGRVWELLINGKALSGWFESLSDAAERARDILVTKDYTLSDTITVDCTEQPFSLDLGGFEITSNNKGSFSFFGGLINEQPVISAAGKQITVSADSEIINYINANIDDRPIIKIVSEDPTDPTDTTSERVGEFVRVQSVSGGDITIETPLYFNYTTNPRVVALKSKSITLENGILNIADVNTIRGTQVFMTKLNSPVVRNIKIVKGNDAGFVVRSCYLAKIQSCSATNLKDDSVGGFLGYGVDDSSSHGTTVDGCYFSNTRHGYTTTEGSYSGTEGIESLGPTMYSRVINCVGESNSSDAFDTHSNAYFISFENIKTFNNRLGAFKDRARFTRVSNLISINDEFGIKTATFSDGLEVISPLFIDTKYPLFLNVDRESKVNVQNLRAEVTEINECFRINNTKLTGDINIKYSGSVDFTKIMRIEGGSAVDLSVMAVDLSEAEVSSGRIFEFLDENNQLKVKSLNVKTSPLAIPALIRNLSGTGTNTFKLGSVLSDEDLVVLDDYASGSFRVAKWDDGASSSFSVLINSNDQLIRNLEYNGAETINIIFDLTGSKLLRALPDGIFEGQQIKLRVRQGTGFTLTLREGVAGNTALIGGMDLAIAAGETVTLIWNGTVWEQFLS